MWKSFTAVAVVGLIGTSVRADITVGGLGPARWGMSGAAIGVEGLTVEDFEDATLVSGLQVLWTAPAGSFGPTSTLPNVFNPATDDPFGTAFSNGAWDGTRALVNTRTNLPFAYNQPSNWGDVEFQFSTPARTVAMSIQQMDTNCRLIVNGVDRGGIAQLTGLTINGQRIGYINITATGADSITSVRISNQNSGDGFVIDHLAFTSTPIPPVRASSVSPSQWGAPNTVLGFAFATFEDFEDTALAPGLQIGWFSPLGDTPVTSTLPNVFAPATDDPFGTAFALGTWSGTHCVLNTRDNQSHPYSELGNWGDIVFVFDPPMTHVGFSVEDMDVDNRVVVNGRDIGLLQSLGSFPLHGRQGWLRLASNRLEPISSVRILNGRNAFNDGLAFDHLGFMVCTVDVNADTVVNSQDLFDFLTLFFAGDPRSDFNADSRLNSQDFFDFVTAFFTGC